MSNVVGRPVKYKPEYCEMLIEHRKQGFSFESFAATISVHRDTLYEWVKVYPDFSDAKKRAKDVSLQVYEKIGIGMALGKIKGDSTAWLFLLKNQHPDKYSNEPSNMDDIIDDIEFIE